MEWSNATLSCAYDCLFTILRNVYINNRLLWIENIKDTNRFITMLTNGWETDGHVHEVTHDKIHKLLNIIDPETFTMGDGTDLFALCREILQFKSFVLKCNYICSQCDELIESETQMYAWWYVNSNKHTQISRLLKNEWSDKVQNGTQCPSCHGQIIKTTQFNKNHPLLICISIGNKDVQITALLSIKFFEASSIKYRLCGIVYHGHFHFTARLIDKAMNTYYYDGMKTGPECILEGKFNTIEDVYEVDQRKASTLVYTLL